MDEVIPDSKAETGIDALLANLESEKGPPEIVDEDARPRDEDGKFLPLDIRTAQEAEESEPEVEASEEDTAPEEVSGEEVDDDPETVIDPPASWTADARARWADIPSDLQAVIAERESDQQSTFQRQVNEAAEQRKTADVEREAAKQERQQLAESLQATLQYAQQMDPVIQTGMQTDWAALAREDPDEYTAQRAQFDQRVQFLQAVKAEHERVSVTSHKETVAEQNAKLNVALPDLAQDADKAWQSYLPTLRSAGYSDQDVQTFRDNMTDHRQVVLIDKAAKYDKVLAERQAIASRKAAKTPPKVQKPKAQQNVASEDDARVAALRKRLNSKFDPTDDITELFERTSG